MNLETIKATVAGWVPDHHETEMCMDLRHLAILREIAKLGWRDCLEIGTWTGCSSAALMTPEIDRHAWCDTHFTPEFLEIHRIGAGGTLHEKPGVDVLRAAERGLYDLIVVDGDHSLPNVERETVQLLRLEPHCIVAHDVFSDLIGIPHCEGPAHLLKSLIAEGWTTVCDGAPREGERTDRGLMAATKDPALAGRLDRIFRQFA